MSAEPTHVPPVEAGGRRIRRHDEGDVVTLTFCRPEAANAIDQLFAEEFAAVAADLAERDDPAVVVLRAEGRVFCAGGDVAAIMGADDPRGYIARLTATLHQGAVVLRDADSIVVAAVAGAAAGAGFGLVLGADLAVASSKASFRSAFAAVGLSPDTGTSYWLPRIVGPRRAADLLLRDRALDAETARDWGILAEVWDAAEFDERATALAVGLAQGPLRALSRSRRLLRDSPSHGFAEHLVAEARSITALIDDAEAQSRIRAFLDRSR
jgi:2-(1,2-epoxy-1,2-dihydrophenyl)acetyl-CoA isomerase